MNIVRWDPFRELEEMNDRLNRYFKRSSRDGRTDQDALVAFDWAPTCDIVEGPEDFVIKAELPGVNRQDVKIGVEDGTLRISGERKQEKEEKDKKVHRIERSYGSFVRTFSLPANIDESKIAAEYKEGVLTVRLPKSPAAKPKTVDVKVS